MNLNHNPDEKKKNEFIKEANAKIIRFASILIAISIVLVCFSYTKIDSLSMQIALYTLAGILFFIGSFVIFIVLASSHMAKNKVNFFLYDKKKKTDIPLSELNISIVRDRLMSFMSLFKKRGKLYVGDLFDENQITIPETMKPLFCYEILCEIADGSGENARIFLSFGHECAEIFSKYLAKSEDYDLALKVKGYIIDFSEGNNKSEEFYNYVVSQKSYIETKMLNYTVSNIEKFN